MDLPFRSRLAHNRVHGRSDSPLLRAHPAEHVLRQQLEVAAGPEAKGRVGQHLEAMPTLLTKSGDALSPLVLRSLPSGEGDAADDGIGLAAHEAQRSLGHRLEPVAAACPLQERAGSPTCGNSLGVKNRRSFLPLSCVQFHTDSREKVWEGCGKMGKGLEGCTCKTSQAQPAQG